MKFTVDRTSGIPYYVQVRDLLQEHLQAGDWQSGDRLPGEMELCQMFDVSRTVIRQALNDLVHRGLVIREKGKGTFVAPPKLTEGLVQKLTGFYQDMVEQGYKPVTQVLRQEVVPASRKVATYLQIDVETPVIMIERLRFVEDVPIQLVTSYLPLGRCEALLAVDLSNQSLYAFLEDECGVFITRGYRTIEAVPANEYEAQLLCVKPGAPLILLDSVSFADDGVPIEYYHALHRGDRTRFKVELVRVRDQGGTQAILDKRAGNKSPGTGLMYRNGGDQAG